jgi:hypothetical protein
MIAVLFDILTTTLHKKKIAAQIHSRFIIKKVSGSCSITGNNKCGHSVLNFNCNINSFKEPNLSNKTHVFKIAKCVVQNDLEKKFFHFSNIKFWGIFAGTKTPWQFCMTFFLFPPGPLGYCELLGCCYGVESSGKAVE